MKLLDKIIDEEYGGSKKIAFESIFKSYESRTSTENIVLGFESRGDIYQVVMTLKEMREYLIVDSQSASKKLILRVRPSASQKFELVKRGATWLMTKEDFDIKQALMIADLKKTVTRGHVFECLLTESVGEVWAMDCVGHTIQGDLVMNGIDYQIKFELARLGN